MANREITNASDGNFLVKLDQGVKALREAKDDFERIAVRDKAAAIKAAAEVLKRKDIQATASALVVRAEKAIADANPPATPSEKGRGKKGASDAPFSKGQIRNWRKAYSNIKEDDFEAEIKKSVDAGEPVTQSHFIKLAESKAPKRTKFTNATAHEDWHTPPHIMDAAKAVLGVIDLDPASSEAANKSVGAKVFFAESDDGLSKEWRGKVWMNPPYTDGVVGRFIGKLVESHQSGAVPEAVCIVNNSTETKWGQLALGAASAVCFPKGRVNYLKGGEFKHGGGLQGQMLCYFGRRAEFFEEKFKGLGVVLPGGSL